MLLAPLKASQTSKIAELDGARAISIVFVLLVHVSYGRLSGGFLGVDVFFVLSGYLITMLLLRELDSQGTIHLGNFYMRRVLRILPPLVLAATLAVALAWGTVSFGQQTSQVMAVLLFYGNFLTPEFMGNLTHTWSLAVEEQFYLVWPGLLLLLSRKFGRWAPAMLAAAIIVMAVLVRFWMVEHVANRNTIYTFTLSRVDGIMLGSLLAILEPWLRQRLATLGERAFGIAAWISGLALVAALLFGTRDYMQDQPVGFFVFAMASAVFLLASQRMASASRLRRALRLPVTQWLGQRSYGLYLYHYPIFLALEAWRVPGDLLNFAVVAAIKVIVLLLFTELAWRFVEQPILGLKKYFLAASTQRPA